MGALGYILNIRNPVGGPLALFRISAVLLVN